MRALMPWTSSRRLCAWLLGLCVVAGSDSAHAWDPVETHPAMVHDAVLQSSLHRRWMEASGQTFGIFTAVRLDPHALPEAIVRDLQAALEAAPANAGIGALGGFGACPGPSAPPATQLRCIAGDQWEASVLAWIKLGVTLEHTPRVRLLHHFVDRSDPRAMTWADPELPASTLRLLARRAGMPLASAVNRTGFDGRAASAAAWLRDPEDPWAPAAMRQHLQKAMTDPDPSVREHELVLGLLGMGALLHVIQDLGVPAHARGDLTAFLSPLSPLEGDFGLPLQEFARVYYGQHALPRPLPLGARPPVALPPTSLEAIAFAEDAAVQGLATFTASRFFSESSLPKPKAVDPRLSPQAAAAVFLGAETRLLPAETEGAVLHPWPAPRGYLETARGRPLAAFETNDAGQITLFLDEVVYRDQALHLVPRSVEASLAVLDLLFPSAPPFTLDRAGQRLSLDLTGNRSVSRVTLQREDAHGVRTTLRVLQLPAEQRLEIVDLGLPSTEDPIVLLFEGVDPDGLPWAATAVQRPAVEDAAASKVPVPTPTRDTPAAKDPPPEVPEDPAEASGPQGEELEPDEPPAAEPTSSGETPQP